MPIDQSKKTALITGITGQDGSYLAELLLAKGYARSSDVPAASIPIGSTPSTTIHTHPTGSYTSFTVTSWMPQT
jgi:hypothetical protein